MISCEKIILLWFKKKKIKIESKEDIFLKNKLDSFAFIELLLYIERKFKVKLSNKNFFTKKELTIKNLVSEIKKKSEITKIKKR